VGPRAALDGCGGEKIHVKSAGIEPPNSDPVAYLSHRQRHLINLIERLSWSAFRREIFFSYPKRPDGDGPLEHEIVHSMSSEAFIAGGKAAE